MAPPGRRVPRVAPKDSFAAATTVGGDTVDDRQRATTSHACGTHRPPVIVAIALAVLIGGILIGRSLTTALIGAIFPKDSASAVSPPLPYGTRWHLEDDDPVIRIKTIKVLAQLNPGNQHVLKWISELLVNDPDPKVRLQAAESLAAANPTLNLLPDLTAALSDSDPRVRERVIVAIASLGADAYSCLPRLQEIAEQSDEDQTVRDAAHAAITSISEDAEAKYSIE
jgi:hypothetical protein